MSSSPPQTELENLTVRSYRAEDQEAVSRLYTDGLLAGQIASNDTGADIENIHEAYFTDPRSHFWVAQVNGRVLGMIGVAMDDNVAEIRRLRVEKEWQHTNIGAKLLETALRHCKHHASLKIVFDTRFEHTAAVELFDRLGFQHTRTKTLHGKELLEFYLDLYRQHKPDGGNRNAASA